jgi:hypothetical protein
MKKMMGINEERVNLNDYKDKSSIIEDIKRIGTSKDGNPITSMKMNTFIPMPNSESEGDKVKIEVILEWKPELYGNKKYLRGFNMKSVVDIKSDVELDEPLVKTILIVFSSQNRPSPHDLISRIYAPYLTQRAKNIKDIDKIMNNIKKDNDALEKVLFGDLPRPSEPKIKNTPSVKPKVQDTPVIEPEVNNEPPQEKPSNDIWSSTSSWDVK